MPTFRPTIVAGLLLAAAACAPAAPSPAPRPVPTEPPSIRPPDVADAEVFEWPIDHGWSVLEVEVDARLGDGGAVAVATVRAAWTPDRIETAAHASTPDDPSLHESRRSVIEAPTDAERNRLRLRFEESVAAGLVEVGPGAFGGRRFEAITTEEGVTVVERWEIGAGDAPWP